MVDAFDPKHSCNNVEMRAIDDEIRDLEYDRSAAATKQWATPNDIRDMDALGLNPTFRRRFKFIAMVGFSSTVVVAWQNMLATFYFALYNGGTGGLFWGFIFSLVAMTLVYLTISELASSFPTAGGQYQWVSECAPPSMSRVLAYITGWLVTLSWVTFLAACAAIIGNLVKFCILIYHPNSAAANGQWLPAIVSLIMLIGGAFFNIHLAKRFPLIEGIMFCIHLAGWAAVIVTLWTTSPRGEVNDVIFSFTNPGGWENAGVACLIGVLTPWSSLIGYDSSVHMTENAKDASRTIPLSLMTAYGVNSIMAFITAITMIFCVGNTEEVLDSFSPFVQVFLNSTGSKAGTVILIVPIILGFCSALISEVATASRQLWSFARDGGLPGGHHLEPVLDAETPRRAVWATVSLSFCIACINFGPVVGFNAIVSLVICALTFSYTITIACTIYRRYFGAVPLPKERFNLGVWGGPINIVALCCVAPVTVLSVFPPTPVPYLTPALMNWAPVVFAAVAVLALVNYLISGRKNFNPPMRKAEY